MLNTMTRPLDSWGHDIYGGPRQGPFYPPEQSPQGLRLPPPSSLFNDPQHHQTVPSAREHAYNSHASSREAYGAGTSIPLHRPAPGPITEPQIHGNGLNGRRVIQLSGRLSPSHSSTTSDRSEDMLVHARHRPLPGDQKPSPATVSVSPPKFTHMHEPSRPASYMEMPPMRNPQDAPTLTSPESNSPRQTYTPPSEPRGPERMKIADLLSNEQQNASMSEKAKGKQAIREPELPDMSSIFQITVRQQPVAARSCGFGERDRRVIDPPPIVQVSIADSSTPENDARARLAQRFSIMHCTIWNEAGDQDVSSMPEDYRAQRRLMGTVVSSPFMGSDENDEEGCFFCFPDLSCRTPGSFRLQFSFVVLDPGSKPGNRIPVAAIVMSDVFTVYNAKDFPGMKASTALTKRLKEQGCLISIKKGNDRGRARDDSDGEDEDNDDDDGMQRRQKRTRSS
ncbi:hypothetical protein F5Y16DRAFT_299118 [Xylariaceae sp. FL0255]|nr:hypothetical protein F5Y16DRAFT_299118 [Xylariaceae sp. FL0255]